MSVKQKRSQPDKRMPRQAQEKIDEQDGNNQDKQPCPTGHGHWRRGQLLNEPAAHGVNDGQANANKKNGDEAMNKSTVTATRNYDF
jgi:hypothetical protein